MVTFNGVNPTAFNVLSDFTSVAIHVLFGLCVDSIYRAVMKVHVRRGKTVPVSVLGKPAPPDFFSGLGNMRILHYSSPAIVFTLMLVIIDYAHTIADSGLSFTRVVSEGGREPVLTLETGARNDQILFEVVGDPFLSRTLINARIGESSAITEPLSASFIAAVDSIARGESPFLSQDSAFFENYQDLNNNFETGEAAFTFFIESSSDPENRPLAAIDLALPLNCNGTLEVQQEQGLTDSKIFNTAMVPNCDYSRARSTGIHASPKLATITAYMSYTPYSVENDFDAFLSFGGVRMRNFELEPNQRALARDRADWKMGRTIDEIDGVAFGDNFVSLDTVVIATGGEDVSQPVIIEFEDGPGIGWERRTQYYLIGQVAEECPLDQQGVAHSACFVVLSLRCKTFPEDYAPLQDTRITVDESSSCSIQKVEMVWGSNFVVDSQFIAAIAGVFGRSGKVSRGARQALSLIVNAAPAALFSLASMSQLPSTKEEVSPEVNGVYIFFMIVPIIIGFIASGIAFIINKHKLHLPESSWQLMVIGAESENYIPVRKDLKDSFPDEDTNIEYGVVDADLSGELILGLLEMRPSQAGKMQGVNITSHNGMSTTPADPTWRDESQSSGVDKVATDSGQDVSPVSPSQTLSSWYDLVSRQPNLDAGFNSFGQTAQLDVNPIHFSNTDVSFDQQNSESVEQKTRKKKKKSKKKAKKKSEKAEGGGGGTQTVSGSNHVLNYASDDGDLSC